MTQAEKFLEPFSFNESFILFIRTLGNLMFLLCFFLFCFYLTYAIMWLIFYLLYLNPIY